MAIILAVLLAGSILFGVLSSVGKADAAGTQSEIDSLKAQQEALDQQQSDIQTQIDSLEYDQMSALSQKTVLDQQIAVTEEEIGNVEDQIASYDDLIVQKQAEVNQKQAEENAQWNLYETRIRAMEENGTVSYFSVIFSATSFSDLLSRIDFVSEIMNYDDEMYNNLKQARLDTLAAIDDMEAAQTELANQKTNLETLQSDLTTQVDQATQLIANIESNIDTYQSQYDEIETANTNLDTQLDALAKQLANEQAAAAAAAAAPSSSGSSSGSSSSGGSSSGSVTATGNFIWPSYCTIVTSEFGWRLHPIYGYYKYHSGVDIGASYGTDVLAADSGTVVVSDYDSGYGNYVMIDHGNGTQTLYGHMSQRLVSVGDTVSQGETIGLVGATGAATGPHIHFEIWVDGSRVNPLDYFSDYTISE